MAKRDMSNQLARIERDGHVGLESLALFLRHLLTLNALAVESGTSRAIGRGRFAAFATGAGQRLASGRIALLAEARR